MHRLRQSAAWRAPGRAEDRRGPSTTSACFSIASTSHSRLAVRQGAGVSTPSKNTVGGLPFRFGAELFDGGIEIDQDLVAPRGVGLELADLERPAGGPARRGRHPGLQKKVGEIAGEELLARRSRASSRPTPRGATNSWSISMPPSTSSAPKRKWQPADGVDGVETPAPWSNREPGEWMSTRIEKQALVVEDLADLPLDARARQAALWRETVHLFSGPLSQPEILLAILRFGAEVLPRGVLFTPTRKGASLAGFGQFDIDLGPDVDADDAVRKIKFPLEGHPGVDQAVGARGAVQMAPGDSKWERYLVEALGGEVPEGCFFGRSLPEPPRRAPLRRFAGRRGPDPRYHRPGGGAHPGRTSRWTASPSRSGCASWKARTGERARRLPRRSAGDPRPGRRPIWSRWRSRPPTSTCQPHLPRRALAQGAGGMLGFSAISQAAHRLESALDGVRMGRIAVRRGDARRAARGRRGPGTA